MVGIYKITNKITGECYIGQSKDIENRFKEHIHHKKTIVGGAIHKYGAENFTFEILEECDENNIELIDKLEDYYILKFKANVPGFGYNQIRGGQHNKFGELNNNVKLTEKDVYLIREAYNNHERKGKVYEKYKDIVTEGTFSQIWEGNCWPKVHMDVYTNENLEYYSRGTTIGEKSASAVFTDDEVLNLRKQYVNKTAKEIYESVKDRCGFQTLQQILWGRSYNHLPIYDKRNKVWINN